MSAATPPTDPLGPAEARADAAFPIPREEARKDLIHARVSIARLERKEARILERLADVRSSIASVDSMVRTILAYYPDLAEDAPRKPLADLFGSDPDFTGGQDSVAFVRAGRGGGEQ